MARMLNPYRSRNKSRNIAKRTIMTSLPRIRFHNQARWLNRRWERSLLCTLMFVLGAIAPILIHVPELNAALPELPPSQYSSTITAPFNQPDYYPVVPESSPLYRPLREWVGRLILPSKEEYQQLSQTTQETDWAWMEVQTAPGDSAPLIGQRVRLAWMPDPTVQAYVNAASRDVRFTQSAMRAWENGTILPVRLDGRDRVGPLQSLAGFHPIDDTVVSLRGAVLVEPSTGDNVTLRIQREPFQETGRYVALVKFLEAVPPQDLQDLPQQCPGEKPCVSDLIQVQHFNPVTKQFDGPTGVLRIPQQPEDNNGIFNMTTRELVKSPAGDMGWYVTGARDVNGLFTVQAMKPRSLFQLKPQETISGQRNSFNFINFDNWRDITDYQGTVRTTLTDAMAKSSEEATAGWQEGVSETPPEGTRAFLIHLYGGRGGDQPNSERYILGNYAGHFSFGFAQVVRDPFTSDLMLDVDYLQVFGNGGDGTMSGGQSWMHYMGSMRRGFMGTRPISDVLVRLDTLTEDYDFGGTQLSFFNELLAQLSLVGARYRIGDGSGDSTITSATSCVQDSAQALFITLRRFQNRIEANPQYVQWMRDNPNDPTTLRFKKLVKLGKDLAQQLTPFGVVRWDWEQNAEVLTGVQTDTDLISIDDFRPRNLLTGLISWRTALPRQAHDEFAKIFLLNGASLWFLRPNQIGGNDPTIAPLEATLIFGAWKIPGTQIPWLSFLVMRVFGAATIPSLSDWGLTLLVGLGLAAIALPIGFRSGLLRWKPWTASWKDWTAALLGLLGWALGIELVFRVLLLPYPKSWIPAGTWWFWALLGLGLFVAAYVLYGRKFRPADSAFAQPPFWILVTLTGIAATLVYRFTGSLWTITVLHWVAASVWWLLLGGHQQKRFREKGKGAIVS